MIRLSSSLKPNAVIIKSAIKSRPFSTPRISTGSASVPLTKILNSTGFIGMVGSAAGAAYLYKSFSDSVAYGIDNPRQKVRTTNGYVLGGLGLTASTAMTVALTRAPLILLGMNPLTYVFGSLALTIPLMVGTAVLDYHINPIAKHLCWAGFNVVIGSGLSMFGIVGAPIICQAATGTGAVMTSLSYIGMQAAGSKHLDSLHAPVAIGIGLVAAAGLDNLFFPMNILYNISLYGGLAVFSVASIADVGLIEKNGELIPVKKYDPISESLRLYLDAINMFQRIAIILFDMEQKKKGRKQ